MEERQRLFQLPDSFLWRPSLILQNPLLLNSVLLWTLVTYSHFLLSVPENWTKISLSSYSAEDAYHFIPTGVVCAFWKSLHLIFCARICLHMSYLQSAFWNCLYRIHSLFTSIFSLWLFECTMWFHTSLQCTWKKAPGDGQTIKKLKQPSHYWPAPWVRQQQCFQIDSSLRRRWIA